MTGAQRQELQHMAMDLAKTLRGLCQAMRPVLGGSDSAFASDPLVRRARRLIERSDTLHG